MFIILICHSDPETLVMVLKEISILMARPFNIFRHNDTQREQSARPQLKS